MRASRVIGGVIGAVMLAAAMPAAAQTAAAPESKVEIGMLGGLSSVQNVGGLAGGQIAVRVTPTVHLVAEGVWMQDTVTRAQLSQMTGLGAFLGNAQGKAATATLKAPTAYGGAGLRFLFPMDGSLHPYIAIGAGVAKITKQPMFTLAGADVTPQLATYGITLGSDLTGDVTKLALTGGFGALVDRGNVSFDLGLRLTSIQTDGQKTNALRGQLGISYRF